MDPLQLLTSIGVGVCVGGMVLVCRSSYGTWIDFVERDLAARLRLMRAYPPQLRRWINMWVAIVVVTFFVLLVGLDSPMIAILMGVVSATGPWYIVRRLSQIRHLKIEDPLADAMVTFSSGIRAGLSLAQALEMVSTECPRPIRQEFQQMVGEYKLGKPLEQTLEEAKERLRSENFVLFAAALLANRKSGGKLNETVERISKSVLELQRLERKIVSETAQARKSAVYMAVVPPVLLIVYAFLDPDNVERMFATLPGQLMLAVAIVLNIVAYLWSVKILHADI